MSLVVEAARRYMNAVAALGKQSGYNGMTFFEVPLLSSPPDIGNEATARWLELNDSGKALTAAIETPSPAAVQSVSDPAPESPSPVSEGIYIASKTKHAHRWLALRDAGEPIISTWIDEAGEGQSADLHDLWRRCVSEAASCRVLVVYREADDVLKGGWVEVGAALAKGIPVYVVGLRDFTIANYRGITHFDTIEAAFESARAILARIEGRR